LFSWGIAPFISGAVSAAIFLSIKFSVLERKESLKWALRAIPFYFAFTAGMLALFIVVEAPTAPSLEQFGAGNAAGIILGVFFGVLAFSYVFFRPYFHRRLIKNDARLRFYHVFLGPTLWKENPWVPFPAPADGEVVIDYYESAHRQPLNKSLDPLAATMPPANEKSNAANDDEISRAKNGTTSDIPTDPETQAIPPPPVDRKKILDPYVRFLGPTAGLPIYYPQRLWSWTKFCVMQGVTRDCVSHSSAQLAATHAKAKVYDNKVEHLWTYAQVASAMMMSIAHGSNDVANAVGPWAAAYATFQSGYVNTTSTTPVFILVVAGLLLGLGFWVFGYHIIRSLGNKITQLSPTRGYSMELGAAITVLLASRLGLPVSTTQCLTGSTVGVALCNFSMGAVNWKQVAFIMSGWLLTLPVAGLISGCLMVMALNAPQF
jgi:sodium-dependent phosphate transporter